MTGNGSSYGAIAAGAYRGPTKWPIVASDTKTWMTGIGTGIAGVEAC